MFQGALIGAIAGGAAALLTELVGRRWSERSRRVVQVIAFVALFTLGRQLSSTALGQSPHEQATKLVESDETYRLLIEADPALKTEAIAFLQGVIERGGSYEDAYAAGAAWGREKLTPYLMTYLPRASDSAVVAFAVVGTDILRELEAADPSSCVAWMFGRRASSAKVQLSKPQHTRITRAINTILREGLHSPQPLDSAAGAAALEQFAARIVELHGGGALEDLVTWSTPQAAATNPAKACATAINMYSTVSQMPPHQGGRVLRVLFASAGH